MATDKFPEQKMSRPRVKRMRRGRSGMARFFHGNKKLKRRMRRLASA